MEAFGIGISGEVAAVLRAAGWSPERHVPIDAMVRVLRSEGVSVHAAAEAILTRFGGMRFKGKGGHRLDFDVGEACRWIDVEAWPFIRMLHSDSACPVAIGEGMIYFVSASGRWMSLHEQWTVCYFLETLDDVFKFALLARFDLSQSVALRGEMVPPAYR